MSSSFGVGWMRARGTKKRAAQACEHPRASTQMTMHPQVQLRKEVGSNKPQHRFQKVTIRRPGRLGKTIVGFAAQETFDFVFLHCYVFLCQCCLTLQNMKCTANISPRSDGCGHAESFGNEPLQKELPSATASMSDSSEVVLQERW
eukprot:3561542-Amphidinium_carterae.1